ncbi:MAG: 4-hydroxy-tetrahydrodipicolinate reductase [Acidimicrobiia bacterium]|nr:4-hydroxy-tetrahydrodipicolinate reductase [Acidimicrobiia bacterium]
MRVGISGAAGRMGRAVATAIGDQPDLDLVALFDPPAVGESLAGLDISDDRSVLSDADVVVEFTRPDVVIDNVRSWRELGIHAVVGTSGFDDAKTEELRSVWGSGPPNCLVVPNFSIGAVLMMRLSALAAPHFSAAEIVELHHDRKVDAPSGTALATADRVAEHLGPRNEAVTSIESVAGSRGGSVSGVPVHSLRLPGLVAHQEVIFGAQGETLTIRHDTTSREAFLPGVLLAVRSVVTLTEPLTVGLDALLFDK